MAGMGYLTSPHVFGVHIVGGDAAYVKLPAAYPPNCGPRVLQVLVGEDLTGGCPLDCPSRELAANPPRSEPSTSVARTTRNGP